MSDPSCATCRSAALAVSEAGPVIQCRRYPPVSALEPPAGEDALDLPEVRIEAAVSVERYPVVTEADWCSGYAPIGPTSPAVPWATKIEPGTVIVLPAIAGMTNDFAEEVDVLIRAACGHDRFVVIWAGP